MNIDILVDLQRGDCGKGKISKVLDAKKNYQSIMKYNGGGNAGHAVVIDGKKHTTHYLTSGMYSDASIVIGPGCVVDPTEFLIEYDNFADKFNLAGRVFIHPFAHIITVDHVNRDLKESVIGTTNKGIGPCYSDKYLRTGKRVESYDGLKSFLLPNNYIDGLNNVLMEGSQGWLLDIDHGDYPYVTSSHIHPAHAFSTFGLSMKNLGKVYGVCKPYETYVGNNNDAVHGDDEFVACIQDVGEEYGETTRRLRDVGYLDLRSLIKAAKSCGVDEIFFNKMDVFEEVGIFKYLDGEVKTSENLMQFIYNLRYQLPYKLHFSGEKDGSDL
jgi:adenylosuccinate synthase